MFAGKQFDIVMGVDIHIIQPGPSVPPIAYTHIRLLVWFMIRLNYSFYCI